MQATENSEFLTPKRHFLFNKHIQFVTHSSYIKDEALGWDNGSDVRSELENQENVISPCPHSDSKFSKEETGLWDNPNDENSENERFENNGISPCPDIRCLNSEGKRGRPRADIINSLIIEGAQSPSSIKCRICNRVFPREKSLQAHLRTHTGNIHLVGINTHYY